ncbi:DNA cytosine methyltransferase [Cupriavidus gilardii]|uniref:DNA cytosine methyltransferase n=1 Tax=Cupriavidus gilardii TaxID=82541 RepID=UPI003B8A6B15
MCGAQLGAEDGLNELHLFAGAGGGILAGQLLGRRCVCAVEREPYAQAVLVARQNDGTFPPFPIWNDVRTFDGRPWSGIVDVVAGGFPCQDISAAGGGAGIDGERSGLWSEMARIIREVRPRKVELENSPMLTSRGLGRVLGDLAEMGFDAEWGVISAADTGAPHLRERIWILAHAVREREQGEFPRGIDQEVGKKPGAGSYRPRSYGLGRWPAEPGMGRVVDGMANRAHRIKALGNGQVPRVAATAWRLLGR